MKIAKLTDVASVLKYLKGRKSFDRVLEQITILSLGDGKCSAELKVEDEHLNSMGILHNGMSTSMVDCISGYALMTKIPGMHMSLDINVKYFNKVKKGDTLLIEGYVNRMGKTIAFLELEMINKETRELVVKGSHTKYIPPQ